MIRYDSSGIWSDPIDCPVCLRGSTRSSPEVPPAFAQLLAATAVRGVDRTECEVGWDEDRI